MIPGASTHYLPAALHHKNISNSCIYPLTAILLLLPFYISLFSEMLESNWHLYSVHFKITTELHF